MADEDIQGLENSVTTWYLYPFDTADIVSYRVRRALRYIKTLLAGCRKGQRISISISVETPEGESGG